MPALVCSVPMARVQLERLLVAQDRVLRPPHLRENVAEIPPQIRVARIELHCFVEGSESIFASSLIQKRDAKVRKILCLGLSPDRARYPLQRMIVLLGMKGQETHKMQSVRVFRIYLEGLPAAKL